MRKYWYSLKVYLNLTAFLGLYKAATEILRWPQVRPQEKYLWEPLL
jgi:hypothetical protein